MEIAKLNFILFNTILYKKNGMELVPSFCFEVMSANIHQIVRKKQGSTKSPPCFLSLLVLLESGKEEKEFF